MTLRVESLSVRQGSFRLQSVSFDCVAGSALALVGASGAGKTTCMEVIAGLRRADAGRVWIDGQDVTDWAPERRGVAYLPQDVALFPHLSVRRNIEFPARIRRIPLDRQHLDKVYEILNISALLDRANVSSLSGGEAQRVALARALAVPPKVLLLDECFGSLDTPLRRRLANQFHQLQELTATTTLVVTHDLHEACLLAERLVILQGGGLHQIGTPDELYRRPATVAVAELLGMRNIYDVRSCSPQGTEWKCDVGGWTLYAARLADSHPPPQSVGFFSWDATLYPDEPHRPNQLQSNLMRLRVVECRQVGADWQLHCAWLSDRTSVAIEICLPKSLVSTPPGRGDHVSVCVPAARVHTLTRN